MSARDAGSKPPYPVYMPEPTQGQLPTPQQIGPPDTRPSQLNPAYSVYRGTWGRFLAGLGDTMDTQTRSADVGIADYPNELNLLAEADDVQGNGMFDPFPSHGNIHPDFGVFGDHEDIPGYVARDRFYEASEVIDGTTGRPVMYVPSGAIALDPGQVAAYHERQLWEIPPSLYPAPPTGVPSEGEVIPTEYSQPIGQAQEATMGGASTGNKLLMFGIAGLGVGILAATLWPKD